MNSKKTELVEVFIPRESMNQDPNYFVGVNGVSYILPRGKKSMVPPAVAEEINRSQAAVDKMFEERELLQRQAAV